MESTDHLRILRRRWGVIAVTALAGAIAAFIATPAKTGSGAPQFVATHRLIQQAPAVDTTQRASARSQADSLAAIAAVATGAEVEQRAAAKLQYKGNPDALGRRVQAKADPQSNTIDISYKSPRKHEAEAVASTFATELITLLDERTAARKQASVDAASKRMQSLQNDIKVLDARIAATPLLQQSVPVAQRDALVRQYSVAYESFQSASQAPSTSGLTTLQPAVALSADRGFQPPRSRLGRMALVGILGLLIGAGLALLVERLDKRLHLKGDVERAFGLPVLAEIPPVPVRLRRRPRVMTATEPNSVVAEAYRSLRTSLMLMHGPDPADANASGEEGLPHVILVTSPSPGEGKTTSAANLAASFAEAGKTVLVIDCDFRHPRIDRYFEVTNDRQGLSDVLAGGSRAPKLRDVLRTTAVRNVWLVPSGRPVDNPAELFARGHELIASAAELADVVILDTPPVLAINDASELVPMADAVLLVCRNGRTSVEAAERSAEMLHRIGAPLRGVILVGAESAPTTKGYYYYYYASSAQGGGLFGLRRLLSRGRPAPRSASMAERDGGARGPSRPKSSQSSSKKGKRRQPQGPQPTGRRQPPAAKVSARNPANPPETPVAEAALEAAPPTEPPPPQQQATPTPTPAPTPTPTPAPRTSPTPAQQPARPAPPSVAPRPAPAPSASAPVVQDDAFRPPNAGVGEPVDVGITPVPPDPIELEDPESVVLRDALARDDGRRA